MLGVLLTGSALPFGFGDYRGGGYGAVGASLPFDEDRFRSIVAKGIEEARKVLSTTRHPVLPDEVPHAYDEKYRLAENSRRFRMWPSSMCSTKSESARRLASPPETGLPPASP